MNSLSLKQKMSKEINQKQSKDGGQIVENSQSNQRINMSAQKSNSTMYE